MYNIYRYLWRFALLLQKPVISIISQWICLVIHFRVSVLLCVYTDTFPPNYIQLHPRFWRNFLFSNQGIDVSIIIIYGIETLFFVKWKWWEDPFEILSSDGFFASNVAIILVCVFVSQMSHEAKAFHIFKRHLWLARTTNCFISLYVKVVKHKVFVGQYA